MKPQLRLFNFRLSSRLLTASMVFITLSACGTQITSLRRALAPISAGASGTPPDVTSLAITNSSPTNGNPLVLNWGLEVGAHTHYCLLENSTDPTACIWRTGALPTTYVDSSPDGLLELTAFLKNSYGVSAPVSSNTVMIDRTAPDLASASVTNSDPTNTAVFGMSYGAVTNGPYSEYCILQNDSSVANCSWQSGALPATFTVSGTDGAKDLSVWIRDAAENFSMRVFTGAVVLDRTIPTVAISNPAAGTFITPANVAAFAVNGTCSENGRNVVITGAASATVVCTGLNWSASLDFSAAAQGTATINVAHTDAAGNAAVVATRSFEKDTAVPTVAVSSPAAGTILNPANQAAFAVSGTCSENGRDVVITGDAALTVACAAGAWSATLDFSAAPQGSVSILVNHEDAAGNDAAPATRTFTKDTVAPSLAISTPAAGTYVNATNVGAFAVTGTCSENGRNVVITGSATSTVVCAAGAWNASLDFSGAAAGSLTIYANHSDAAANAATQSSRSFTKDVVLPTVAISSPAAGSFITATDVGSFAVTGTCSENGRNVVISGDASATVVCSAGAWSTNLDFTSAAAGNVSIAVNQSDAAGNAATTATRSFTKDAVLPTVAITSPVAGSTVNSVNMGTFAVSGTCSEDTRNVVLSGDAALTVVCASGTWSASLDFTAASDGPVTIYADHTDAAGNVAAQDSRGYTKSTGLPVLTISSPAAGAYANIANVASFPISGTCSENGRNVVITGDATATVVCTAGAWSASLDFSAAAAGTISVTANHSDAALNPANPQTRSFTKDVTAPSAPTISIAGGAVSTSANPVSLVLSASGATQMYITNTAGCGAGGAWETYATSKGSWTLGQTNATATVYVKYRDAAGNESTCENDTILHDSTAPVPGSPALAIETTGGSTHTNEATPDLTISATGATEMYVTNTAGCGSGGSWVTYAASQAAWPLDAGQLNNTATVYIKFRDATGNESTCEDDSVIHDNVAPAPVSISIAAGAAQTNDSTPDLTLAATDAGGTSQMYVTNVAGCASGGAWEAFATSKSGWPLGQTNGTATVYARFQDAAGNLSACVSDTIIHDNTLPTVAISAPAASSYISSTSVSSFAVNGTCSENTRNVVITGDAAATVVCTAGAWSTTLDFTAAADGTVGISVNHNDAAGNAAVTATRNFTKDTVAPALASIAITNTSPTNSTSYGLTFGAITNGPYAEYCLLENTTLVSSCSWTAGSIAGPYTVSATNNSKTISAYLRDAAGNVSTVATSAAVVLDTVAPTVAFTSPADGSTITNVASWTVNGSCSENGRNVVITGDASATVTCTAGAWTANLDFTAAAPGTVTVTANHSDAAGNTATAATRSYEKLPLPGAFALTSATPGNQSVTLVWASATNAATYEVSYGTVSGTWGTTFTTNGTSPTTVTGLTNGTEYFFMVTAVNGTGERDASGELSATPNLVIAITAGPTTLNTGICSSSAYTVTSRDAAGTAYAVPANLTVNLTHGSGTTFYDSTDTTCSGAAVTSVVIASGTSTKSFYTKANLAQTSNLAPSAAGYVSSPLAVTSSWNPTRMDLVAGSYMGLGSSDGNGTAARFHYPVAVVADTANNVLYISDQRNCTIRKLDLATTAVTTLAGTAGQCSVTNANGTAARFDDVSGLTYDGTRYLYAVERTACKVRRIDTQSPFSVTTVVDSACSYSSVGDGTSTGSRLYNPVAIHHAGTMLYISEANHAIRRVDLSLATTSSSYVTEFVGTRGTSGSTNANGTAALVNAPTSFASDATYLYFADHGNNRVRKVTLASPYTVSNVVTSTTEILGMARIGTQLYYTGNNQIGTVTTAGAGKTILVGTGDRDRDGDRTGAGADSTFFQGNMGYLSMTADSNFVYVPDPFNHNIKRMQITAPYTVTTIAGSADKSAFVNGTGTAAKFNQINAATTDGSAIFLGEGPVGNIIRKYDIATQAVTTLAGTAVTPGCADGAAGTATFTHIRAMVYRAADGLIYLWDEDCSGGVLRTVHASTGFTTTLAITGVAVPSVGAMTIYGNQLFLGSAWPYYNIWSVDLANAAYPVTTVAGTGSSGDGVGPGTTTPIGPVSAIWADANYVYWYDVSNYFIKMIDYTASNTISFFAGTGSRDTTPNDGTGTSSSFYGAYRNGGMDSDGTNFYRLELEGMSMRKTVISTAVVTTIIGPPSGTNYSQAVNEELENDGVISTTNASSLAEKTMGLIYTPHGIFVTSRYGLRWYH